MGISVRTNIQVGDEHRKWMKMVIHNTWQWEIAFLDWTIICEMMSVRNFAWRNQLFNSE